MAETTEQEAVLNQAPQQDETTESATVVLNGAEALRRAADQTLQEYCTKITKGLADSAEKGHSMSARLLYNLATDKVKMTAAEVERRKSMAAILADNPDWDAELDEDSAEIFFGSREPE